MHTIQGKNITEVFYKSLKMLKTSPDYYTNDNILELTPAIIKVEKPMERCLVIPHRNNNIIQSIAETLWVLGGKDDLQYLSKYLPRASQFSDDGMTWRGAYGKRLRGWFNGVNQIQKILEVLRGDQYSARGIMVLFDPATDISLTYKDVPCNNWIQFSTRENKLNMHVTVRANDLIWGFSGINFFEWTTLQELLANWLNVEIGHYYHFAGFLQLYNRHFKRADSMLQHQVDTDIYSHKSILHVPVDIKENIFKEEMDKFFLIEKEFTLPVVFNVDSVLHKIKSIESNYLQHCLKLMLSYILLKNQQYDDFLLIFDCVIEDDLKISAASSFIRITGVPSDIKNLCIQILVKYHALPHLLLTNPNS